jgi:hypothetical protein
MKWIGLEGSISGLKSWDLRAKHTLFDKPVAESERTKNEFY